MRKREALTLTLYFLPLGSLVDPTISTEQNKAYQAFTAAQPQIEKSVNNSPSQGETNTYDQVGESTHVHTSCDIKNPSEGLYEN